ncbi:MAG: hypothetical protein COB83_09335 [Gammaproteobacteria bacterium]|nr:MAG: hypothetical protein COB83_09335 [Gammaproteobacteria bacterium]
MNFLSKLTFWLLLVSSALFSQAIFSMEVTNNHFKVNEQSGKLSNNISKLRLLLLSDQQVIVIALPLPNGKLVNFKLMPNRVVADELAKKYPNIKTFYGVSLDNPSDTGRFDITPNGFHAMFYHQGERVFIDPKSTDTQALSGTASQPNSRVFDQLNNEYTSYFSQGIQLTNRTSHKFHQPKKIPQQFSALNYSQLNSRNKTDQVSTMASGAINSATSAAESAIKTYRIAIAAAAEYTEFNGGTVDSALAEIVTMVNRLNQVFQRDLAIRLELVSNNDLLIYIDASTDPFSNTSDDGEINTGVIDGVIGSENYDIGHVVNTDGGGLAILGGVCHSIYKGDGITGSPNPINDAFYIDFVAHEIGHQFGAEHTFNGSAGACSGNRVASSAYEVGSGSTIMAYAGICEDQNLQSHSDALFHVRSIDQVSEYLQGNIGSTCGTVTGNANNTAIVDAGLDYTIPARTPFKLSGSASDLDSVNLSYSWQQFDLGNASASLVEQVDDGSRPLFRTFLPSSAASRYFPKLSDVLNNTTSNGESLPTTNRELNFRLMVLDNEGGVSFDETKLTVVNTGEAFSIISPILDDVWIDSSNNISWQVAETNVSPISCATVDVLLSKDGGENFDVVLVSNLANSGSSEISIDAFCADDINTSQARIKLLCSNNIFFAINEGTFSINKALTAEDIAITAQQTLSLTQGESIEINSAQFTYQCETPDSIIVQSGDNYSFTGTTITPNSDFSGALSVGIIANKNDISSEIFTVNISVEAKPTPAPTPEPIPPAANSSGSVFWLLLFAFMLPWRTLQLVKSKQA